MIFFSGLNIDDGDIQVKKGTFETDSGSTVHTITFDVFVNKEPVQVTFQSDVEIGMRLVD